MRRRLCAGERREKSAARCPEACIDADTSLAAPQALRKAAAAEPRRGAALFPRAAPKGGGGGGRVYEVERSTTERPGDGS